MAASSFTRSLFSSNPSRYDSLLTGNPALMSAPTATDGGTGSTASVAFTTVASATSYGVLSSPGSFTATGTTSPLTVSGLSSGTAYTFQVRGINSTSTGPYSAASNSVTPVNPANFESIATATGTGSSATITFTSIPSTYRSLQFRILGKNTGTSVGGTQAIVRFNSDTGTNYAFHYIRAEGTTVAAGGGASNGSMEWNGVYPSSAATQANMMGIGIIDVIDYASTSKYKTLRSLHGWNGNDIDNGWVILSSGLWMSTSAINSVSIITNGSNWTSGTTISLYGVK
jgi:hypothetical protein